MLRAVTRAATVAARAPRAFVAVRGISVAALETRIANAIVRGDRAGAAALQKQMTAAKKADAKSELKAAGTTSPWCVFIAKELKGQKVTSSGRHIKAAAAKWRNMTDAQKKPFRDQAARNSAKRRAIKAKRKAPPNKYAKFMKAQFPAAYKTATASGKSHAEAFKQATRKVKTLWKAK
eukprot:TRINITY_DN612_c0_g1_i2.p3 TRINITY_DN612_c0_g1~~TRINITY_DN612_c0_g1_i2.p3  ORF type:complete len:178 (+),score=78.79 TRINITY_DN612_c0_g1_i2:96-629(+)